MRSMTTLFVAVLLAIPLDASAQGEEEPLVLGIDHETGTPAIQSRQGFDGVIRADIVGYFLWLEWGDPDREADDMSEDIVSIDVSDPTITQVRAYLDGTVDVIREEPEPKAPVVSESELETVDLVVRFPGIRWGAILPGGLRVE